MADPRIEPPILTIRTVFMLQLQTVLEAAPYLYNDPMTDPDYVRLFDIVKKGTIDDIAINETPGCSIEEGKEDVINYLNLKTDKKLRIYINFKVIKAQGVDPDELINYYFGRLTQILVNDPSLAALTIDVSEAGNSLENLGDLDQQPGGTAYFDVQFRNAYGNPFSE